jgi:hypothetical protein
MFASSRRLMAPLAIALLACPVSVVAKGKPSGDTSNDSPAMSFAADKEVYQPGERARLSWASINTRFCNASGDWSGKWPTEGVYQTQPLTSTGVYELKCSAKGGAVKEQLVLTVAEASPEPILDPQPEPAPEPEPVAEPTIAFSSDREQLRQGETAILNWSTTNADSCSGSGAWAGEKTAAGSAQVGPITERSTFTLSCTGAGGSALAMLSINHLGVVELRWQAPTQNIDGSPLTDLAGYQIYFGLNSGSYDGTVAISDPLATNEYMELPSGDHFISISAIDADGNESGLSNEIMKTVP